DLAVHRVVLQPHLARGLLLRVVGDAGVEGPRIDVQADGALVERIGDAVDGVVALLQVEGSLAGAGDAAVGYQPDGAARTGAVEADVVVQPQRAALDGEPAELPGMVVDGARGARLPAQCDQLEEIVAVDEVAGVSLRYEV